MSTDLYLDDVGMLLLESYVEYLDCCQAFEEARVHQSDPMYATLFWPLVNDSPLRPLMDHLVILQRTPDLCVRRSGMFQVRLSSEYHALFDLYFKRHARGDSDPGSDIIRHLVHLYKQQRTASYA